MTQHIFWQLAVLTIWLIATEPSAHAAAEVQGTDPQLLSENRVLLGTVEEIRSDQAKINIGEGQPRYIRRAQKPSATYLGEYVAWEISTHS